MEHNYSKKYSYKCSLNKQDKDETGSQTIQRCRVCETEENLVDISTNGLIEKLHKIGDFKANYDYWLKFICIPCSLQLQNAFEFKTQSEETYRKLINLMENTEYQDSNDSVDEKQSFPYEIHTHNDLNDLIEEEHEETSKNSEDTTRDSKSSPCFDYEFFEPIPNDDSADDEKEKTYFELFEIVDSESKEKATESNVSLQKLELLPETLQFLRRRKRLLKGQQSGGETEDNLPRRKPGRKPQGKKTYTCAICSKTYSQKHNINDHIMTFHLKKNAYTCNFCGKTFKYNGEYYKHRKQHTASNKENSEEKPGIPCEICQKVLKNSQTLHNHMKIHQEPREPQKPHKRPYLCHYCGYESRSITYLRAHLRSHRNCKSYKCNECGKEFKWKIGLAAHMKIHSGKKSHSCHLCPKKFLQTSHLKQHIMTHTGVREHHCKVCGKGFRFPHNVREHMRVHTGEKPHQCSKCLKKFAQERTMKKHKAVCSTEDADIKKNAEIDD